MVSIRVLPTKKWNRRSSSNLVLERKENRLLVWVSVLEIIPSSSPQFQSSFWVTLSRFTSYLLINLWLVPPLQTLFFSLKNSIFKNLGFDLLFGFQLQNQVCVQFQFQNQVQFSDLTSNQVLEPNGYFPSGIGGGDLLVLDFKTGSILHKGQSR